MLNLPNLLSIFRILLVPPLVVVLLTKFEGKEWWGLGLFLLAAVMDFFDGYLARRRKQVTRLGTLLDPAADKILVAAAYISLVELDSNVVPSWIVVVIVAREFAVTALRSFAAAENLVIPAGASGKVKTIVQIVSIALLIIYN
jgi:CDP-diacylglycerol--glycerol-3-phosphate 3-phosphatidyltransferase